MIRIRARGLSPRALAAYPAPAVNRLARTVLAGLAGAAGLVTVMGVVLVVLVVLVMLVMLGVRDVAAAEPRPRRFMVGIEGLGLQVPALRPRLGAIDPRYLGRSVTLGGFGLFGRWQAAPIVGLELGVRSGSLRYHNAGDVISQDIVMGEAGVLLYLARGTIGQLALDAGGGGMMHAIRYELADRPGGSQIVGAGFFRVGVDLELRLRRLAFTASLRSYGVITDVARTRSRGLLFADVDAAERRAPLAVFQTHLLGSVGIAYRF